MFVKSADRHYHRSECDNVGLRHVACHTDGGHRIADDRRQRRRWQGRHHDLDGNGSVVVRQRAVGVPPDGRPAIGRAAGDRGPQVVHGPGKRTAAGRLVRAVAGRRRVRPVRVVRGARPEHGPERGAGADVRGRGGRAQAPGPPVVDAHVHHHARFVRLVPHVDGHAVADGRHDQHGRARRVVCRRRAPGKLHIIIS